MFRALLNDRWYPPVCLLFRNSIVIYPLLMGTGQRGWVENTRASRFCLALRVLQAGRVEIISDQFSQWLSECLLKTNLSADHFKSGCVGKDTFLIEIHPPPQKKLLVTANVFNFPANTSVKRPGQVANQSRCFSHQEEEQENAFTRDDEPPR